jgi:hypothetical protein
MVRKEDYGHEQRGLFQGAIQTSSEGTMVHNGTQPGHSNKLFPTEAW